jgi:hypothetical protein
MESFKKYIVPALLSVAIAGCGTNINNIPEQKNNINNEINFSTLAKNAATLEIGGSASVVGSENASLPSIYYSAPDELKAGNQLPANIEIMKSMNNVDLIKHNDRYYMSFRTAPSHFASSKTLMHVLSSDDGKRWQLEYTIRMGADVREPRFLSLNGKLFLYFFKLGTNPFAFEPQDMYLTEKTESGWSSPEKFFRPGFVDWRARVYNGKAYMSVYYGKGLYGSQSKAEIYLLSSEDGRNWTPVSETTQVSIAGAEEPEFEFDKEGNIWGTIRMENSGGGYTFFAPKDHLDKWQLHHVPEKYDSALMLRHGDEMYLLARRNVDGNVDKAPKFLPESLRKWLNLARYSLTKKRTAMYHFDKAAMTVNPLFDFPSHGDTAFPAIAPLNDSQYLFLNYSSELGIDKDYKWIVGQLKTTRLYAFNLTFSTPGN